MSVDPAAPFRDPQLAPEKRAADLLGRMTAEEKVAQLCSVWLDPHSGEAENHPFGRTGGPVAEPAALLRHGIGQITRPYGTKPIDPDAAARVLNEWQRRLVEETRLGIPAIAHEEALTGVMGRGATQFPSPLNYGATWEPELIERVGAVIRRQMRAIGLHQALAPVADVIRDARWGRVEECVAEDPFLVGSIVTAYVRGLQGERPEEGIVATLKHFCGYSGSEGGRNFAPTHVGPRELQDVYLLPFEMAVKLGGARSVMNSYQEIDGEPSAASHRLLTEILRDAWGFTGIVVADYFAVNMLTSLHRVAADAAEAAAAALGAGLDVELPAPMSFPAGIPEALRRGILGEATVDRAVERVLRTKFEAGIFERPFVDADAIELDLPAERELAREVAERSIVLLKNEGVLPLARGAGRVAVVGPNADDPMALFGNYSYHSHVASFHPGEPLPAVETLLGALRRKVGDERVLFARGCSILREPDEPPTTPGWMDPDRRGDERLSWDESGIEPAAELASGADVIVAVVGDRAGNFRRGTVGEGTDTDDLRLPGLQERLLQRLFDTGKPVVVVLLNGRPFALPTVAERAAAIVEAWFPGQAGAGVVADVLLGDLEPAGRLTTTFSRATGAQPRHVGHKSLSRGVPPLPAFEPVFPFGHGLSYTRFSYSDLAIDPERAPVDGEVAISCTLRNVGERPGDEVVQLYVRDHFASLTRPEQQLLGFRRVSLEPGAEARVRFRVHADRLAFTGRSGRRIVEPGSFAAAIGASSGDLRLTADFELCGDVREVGEDRVLETPVEIARPR